MEFNQLLSQLSSLEGAQRQDKSRITEIETKYKHATKEVEEGKNRLQEVLQELQREKQKSASLEVANMSNEKTLQQLKSALKKAKEDIISEQAKASGDAEITKTKRQEYVSKLNEFNQRYRDMLKRYESDPAMVKITQLSAEIEAAKLQIATLESRNADSENSQLQHVGNLTKSSEKTVDDRSEQDVDILRSEKEDLQERLEASLVEIKNLSDGKDELVSFVYSLQEKYNQAEEILREGICPKCGEQLGICPPGNDDGNINCDEQEDMRMDLGEQD